MQVNPVHIAGKEVHTEGIGMVSQRAQRKSDIFSVFSVVNALLSVSSV
jgi:hypothetical protein